MKQMVTERFVKEIINFDGTLSSETIEHFKTIEVAHQNGGVSFLRQCTHAEDCTFLANECQ